MRLLRINAGWLGQSLNAAPGRRFLFLSVRFLFLGSILLFQTVGVAPTALAQLPAAQSPADRPEKTVAKSNADPVARSAEAAPESQSRSFLSIIFSGGLIGFLILLSLLLLSLAAVALAVEHLMTIRESVLMPPGLAEQVRSHLSAGNRAAADQTCQANPSFLSFVLRAGLAEVEGGWAAVEKALEDATAEQAARLFRKIEYLSVIGNIAPMIGLLGTVIGMIFAFQEVADTQGAARAAQLAEGIYTALVTTVGGLLVAIPSLAGFAIFRNRVDQLVAEASYAALHAVAPLKRLRTRTAAAKTTPAAAKMTKVKENR